MVVVVVVQDGALSAKPHGGAASPWGVLGALPFTPPLHRGAGVVVVVGASGPGGTSPPPPPAAVVAAGGRGGGGAAPFPTPCTLGSTGP